MRFLILKARMRSAYPLRLSLLSTEGSPYRAPMWPRGGRTCFLGGPDPKRHWEELSLQCVIYSVQIYGSNHPSLPRKWMKVKEKNLNHKCLETTLFMKVGIRQDIFTSQYSTVFKISNPLAWNVSYYYWLMNVSGSKCCLFSDEMQHSS